MNYLRHFHAKSLKRTLTTEQKEEMDCALFQHDGREAIRLYQRAFSDADRAEARAYVAQRFEDLRRHSPKEFAAAAPRLWDLNWRAMAICVLIEVPIVAAFWLVLRPANPMSAAVGCGLGATFSFSIVHAANRQFGSKRRRLAIATMMAMLIFGALAFQAGTPGLSGPPMYVPIYVGIFCGAALMISGSTPKRRRRPNSP